MAITWRQLTSNAPVGAALQGMQQGGQNIEGMLSTFRNVVSKHKNDRTQANEADLRGYLQSLDTPEALEAAQQSGALDQRIAGYGEFVPVDGFSSITSAAPGEVRKRLLGNQQFEDGQASRALRPVQDDFYARLRNGDTAGATGLLDANDFGEAEAGMGNAIKSLESANAFNKYQGELASGSFLGGDPRNGLSKTEYGKIAPYIQSDGSLDVSTLKPDEARKLEDLYIKGTDPQRGYDSMVQRILGDKTLSPNDRQMLLTAAEQKGGSDSLGVVNDRIFNQMDASNRASMGMDTNLFYQASKNPNAMENTLGSMADVRKVLEDRGVSSDDAVKYSKGLYQVMLTGVDDGTGNRAPLPMNPAVVNALMDQATDDWLTNDLTTAEAAEQFIESTGISDQFRAFNAYRERSSKMRSSFRSASGLDANARRFAQSMYQQRSAPSPVSSSVPQDILPTVPTQPEGPPSYGEGTDNLVNQLRSLNRSNITLTPEQEARAGQRDSSWLRNKAANERYDDMEDTRSEYLTLVQELQQAESPEVLRKARQGSFVAEGKSGGSGRSKGVSNNTRLRRMVELEKELRQFLPK